MGINGDYNKPHLMYSFVTNGTEGDKFKPGNSKPKEGVNLMYSFVTDGPEDSYTPKPSSTPDNKPYLMYSFVTDGKDDSYIPRPSENPGDKTYLMYSFVTDNKPEQAGDKNINLYDIPTKNPFKEFFQKLKAFFHKEQ